MNWPLLMTSFKPNKNIWLVDHFVEQPTWFGFLIANSEQYCAPCSQITGEASVCISSVHHSMDLYPDEG